MQETGDIELLRQYAGEGSERAFETLVARYLNLVYSAALRKTGNASAAEEITQAVFIILARKAGRLRKGTILSGWLYQTARLTASSFLRNEIRRARREQEASVQSLSNETESEFWREVAPLLEDAMGTLGEKDRNALVLRFFEGKSFQEVGAAFGGSENAAKKRVAHALEKLRKFFAKRGVVSTTAIIAGVISGSSVQAAPIGLATTIAATAAEGSVAAASTLTLVKGALNIMAWTKAKTALVAGAAVILAIGTTTVIVKKTVGSSNMTAQRIAQEAQSVYASLSSYSDTGKVVSKMGDQDVTTTFSIKLQRPNLYRVDWTQTSGTDTSKGSVWSAGDGDFVMTSVGNDKSGMPERKKDMLEAVASATGVSGQAAATILTAFFEQNWGDALRVVASGRFQSKKQGDEKVDGVDCYVVSSVIDSSSLPGQGNLPGNRGTVGTATTTLWIGKRDHLIHQTRTTMEGFSLPTGQISDSAARAALRKQNKAATPEAIAAYKAEMAKSIEQAQEALKSGFVFTQTHENIVLNNEYSVADFAP